MLDALEAKRFSIFRRLALDLLVKHPDPELAEPRLVDEELFGQSAYSREYGALSEQVFTEISAEGQAKILSWIEAAQAHRDEEDRRAWQRRMIERLGAVPKGWEDRYEDLASDPLPDVEVVPDSGFVGPTSPLREEELASMDINALIAMLESWEPDGSFTAPSPEGLARTLRQVIASEPGRFAVAAPKFAAGVDPTYVRALLGGLTEARKAGRAFRWRPVLELCVEIVGRPREIEGRDPRSMEVDYGWQWSWRESVELITAGLSAEEAGIALDDRELAWKVISTHAEDPDPDPAREASSESNPETLAINSIRGLAVRAVFTFAWWLKDEESATAPPRSPSFLSAIWTRKSSQASRCEPSTGSASRSSMPATASGPRRMSM